MSNETKERLRNKLFISQGTIIGFVILAFVVTIFLILEITVTNPFTERVTTALLGITIILFLLGFIIDQLKYRDFRFWALGAMVSFLGVVLLFSPVVFYGLGNNDHLAWFIVIIAGILLILFGYTIEAYELNNKVAKILINLWDAIRTFQWRKIPKRIGQLIVTITTGIAAYIIIGFRRFKYVVKRSFQAIFGFISLSLKQIYRLVISLPRYTKRFIIFCYEFNYWLIIPLFAFSIIKILNLPFPNVLVIVLLFLTLLLLVLSMLQSIEELALRYLQILRMRSWETFQGISIRIQRTASSVGRYKCTNCNAPVKLGQ